MNRPTINQTLQRARRELVEWRKGANTAGLLDQVERLQDLIDEIDGHIEPTPRDKAEVDLAECTRRIQAVALGFYGGTVR